VSTPPPDYPYYPEWNYPPPRYGPPAYPAAGYPPPSFPAPGYAYPYPGYAYPYPGYAPPYPGYASKPGYGMPAPQVRPAFAPGIIPVRPLNLSDIFNGAAVYIRANPKAILGLTTVIVVITQIITLVAATGPLAAAGRLSTAPSDELTGSDVGAWMLSTALTGVVGWLAGILLTGTLTVVAARAIFGSTISAGETWARVRGRLPALIGLVALECAGLVTLAGVVGLIVAAIAAAGNPAATVILGLPLVLMSVATVIYLYTALSFAPVLIVLERLPVVDSITRSLALVRNSFWRVLGIRMLTWLVITLIAGAIAAPFNFLGHLAGGPALVAATVGAVGAAIGRIVTAPFGAGVVVLLYTDRRIRSEAFDLVLQSGAAVGPAAGGSTDYLWLTRPV
jgi:hypothetical protein